MDNLEKVQAVFKLLTEDTVDYVDSAFLPQLPAAKAKAVIHHMQNRLKMLPSSIRTCVYCGEFFDEDYEGHYTDSTEEPDEWHIEQGITQADIQKHGNANFCDPYCEAGYFLDKKIDRIIDTAEETA